MTTRTELERQYVTRDGIIRNPGKFQGEPLWAPAMYDRWNEGFASCDGGNQEEGTNAWAAFRVDDELRAEWGDVIDASTYALGIEEDDAGFVFSQELSRAEYDKLEYERE